jgi:hypothetical protein
VSKVVAQHLRMAAAAALGPRACSSRGCGRGGGSVGSSGVQ